MIALPKAHRPEGFTLSELLVVIGIIALLVTILVPAMSQAWHVAYDRMCRGHLWRLGQAMHGQGMTGGAMSMTVSTSGGWTGAAVQYGSKDLLLCKEDIEPARVKLSALQDYWILQQQIGSNWVATDVSLALGFTPGVGQALGDPQLFTDDQIPNPRRPPPGGWTHQHQCWHATPESRAPNQKMISITDEAELLATFEETQVTLESWHGCGVTHCNSNHWLMKGPLEIPPNSATKPPLDKVVFQMGGRDFQAEPVPRLKTVVTSAATSYGMTDLVTGRMVSPSQILLMDANLPSLCAGEPGWLDHVKARHFGKVNYVDVGGSVHSISKPALAYEYDLWSDKGPSSQSLLGYNASPQVGKE